MASLKTAVVTGGNRGLGLELVRQMAEESTTTWGKIYALCRKTSENLTALAQSRPEVVVVVEGIDVSSDGVGETLKASCLKDAGIDLLVHNAGGYGPLEGFPTEADMYASQSLANVTMDRLRGALELNTLGPLRVTQALLDNLKKTPESSKIVIISSAMGSIADNTSGGHYGYRTAKAGINMIGRSLAQDLKQDGIAVGLVHPGFVLTGFDSGAQHDKDPTKRRQGQRDVDVSATGVLQAIEKITLENTGAFWHGNYGEGVKQLPW